MRRACLFFLVLLIALGSAASAEKIRIGDTVCLLQAAPEKDARKLYILFLG